MQLVVKEIRTELPFRILYKHIAGCMFFHHKISSSSQKGMLTINLNLHLGSHANKPLRVHPTSLWKPIQLVQCQHFQVLNTFQ